MIRDLIVYNSELFIHNYIDYTEKKLFKNNNKIMF